MVESYYLVEAVYFLNQSVYKKNNDIILLSLKIVFFCQMQEENLFTEMNEDDIAERVRNFMQALTKNNSADWERSILVEL